VKPTSPPQDKKIIALLKSLGTLKAEYPPELLAARRAAFAAQIEEHNITGANTQNSPARDQVIQLLQDLKPVIAEYPADMLAARRAAFIAQIEEHNREAVPQELPAEEKVIELLGNLKPAVADYPPDLLAARRAAFIAQIRQHNSAGVQEKVPASQNGSIHKLFERLKSIEVQYPLKMWSARRSVFVNQVRDGKISVLDALRFTIQRLFRANRNAPAAPTISFQRVSLILVTLLVAVFVGSLAYGIQQPLTGVFEPSPAQEDIYPSQVAAATGATEVAEVICKPGYEPPLCLAQEFDKSRDLTDPENGSARPAVAKDTIPGYSRIHRAAYVNDGLYGPGASWISNSAYSWIKIDLGEARTINTIKFGRDRLGGMNDGDPGQFIIAVALSDDVYADGNSHNDSMEYTVIYDSDVVGFDGIVSGAETIEATFDTVKARYVKITFENAGTAVDEIEVFMIQPGEVAGNSTPRPRNTSVPRTFTAIPTSTLVPSKTATLIPTRTPFPTFTATLRPTFTPLPTDTDVPTNTPEPPTDTPVPPTDTPVPPTDTEEPPTDTPEPPTDTPVPPTDTEEPPTSTSESNPESFSTETPELLAP
jgi:hypothetical protein